MTVNVGVVTPEYGPAFDKFTKPVPEFCCHWYVAPAIDAPAVYIAVPPTYMVEVTGCSHWTQRGRTADENKLIDFTHPNGRYQYGLGAFVDFKEHDAEITYYKTRVKQQPAITVP